MSSARRISALRRRRRRRQVALQVAEQMSDYLTRGAITNAVNFPSISAEEAPRLRPVVELAEKLGLFVGQIAAPASTRFRSSMKAASPSKRPRRSPRRRVRAADGRFWRARTLFARLAREGARRRDRGGDARRARRLRVAHHAARHLRRRENHRRTEPCSTMASRASCGVGDIAVEAEFAPSMIYVYNEDKPGFIGRFAGLAGRSRLNIATFALGRDQPAARPWPSSPSMARRRKRRWPQLTNFPAKGSRHEILNANADEF